MSHHTPKDEKIGFKGFRSGVLETTVDVQHRSMSLVDYVAFQLSSLARPASSLDALSLIELGSLYVNDERTLNPARTLRQNDKIRIHSEPRRFPKPVDLRARVVEEDESTLSIYKPEGLPCGPTVDNLQETLVSYLSDERHQSLYLIHSIDTETEGLVVLAKSPAVQETAQRKFAANAVTRRLVAFVERPVEPRIYNSSIEILSCESRFAETGLINEGFFSWQVLGAPLPSYLRLEIELKNARPSDLRDLLAALDSPVLGDRTHGSPRTLLNPKTQKASTALMTTRFLL